MTFITNKRQESMQAGRWSKQFGFSKSVYLGIMEMVRLMLSFRKKGVERERGIDKKLRH